MGYTVIVLSSVTYALKAQRILMTQGISSLIEKLTSTQSKRGCGYGVRVADANLESALTVLKKERIRVTDTVKAL